MYALHLFISSTHSYEPELLVSLSSYYRDGGTAAAWKDLI